MLTKLLKKFRYFKKRDKKILKSIKIFWPILLNITTKFWMSYVNKNKRKKTIKKKFINRKNRQETKILIFVKKYFLKSPGLSWLRPADCKYCLVARSILFSLPLI